MKQSQDRIAKKIIDCLQYFGPSTVGEINDRLATHNIYEGTESIQTYLDDFIKYGKVESWTHKTYRLT